MRISTLCAVLIALAGCSEPASQVTRRQSLAAPSVEDPRFEKVRISTEDGETLQAQLFRPIGQGQPAPAVILVHGFNGDATGVAPSAKDLASRGYVTLALSLRGWGESTGKDDCGLRQPADVMAAISFLSSQPYIDRTRIGVLGFSQGGQVALLSSSKSERVASVVAFFPVTDLARWGDTTTNGAVRQYVKSVCSPDLRSRSPLMASFSNNTPTLLVHGARDSRVPAEQSIRMQKRLKESGTAARLLLVPGAGHLFEDEDWRQVWPEVVEHLNKTLRPGEPIVAAPKMLSEYNFPYSEDTSIFVVGSDGAPAFAVVSEVSSKARSILVSPSCVGCALDVRRALEDAFSGKIALNVAFGAYHDADLEIGQILLCGNPAEAALATLNYYDMLSRSDLTRGGASEGEIAEILIKIARKSRTSKVTSCPIKPGQITGMAEAFSDPHHRAKDGSAEVVRKSDGGAKPQTAGAVGVGPSYTAINDDSTRVSSAKRRAEIENLIIDLEYMRDLDNTYLAVFTFVAIIDVGVSAIPAIGNAWGLGRFVGEVGYHVSQLDTVAAWKALGKEATIQVVEQAIPGAALQVVGITSAVEMIDVTNKIAKADLEIARQKATLETLK